MSITTKYQKCRFWLLFLSSFALTLSFVISIATGWVNVNYLTKDRSLVSKESAISGKSERKEDGTVPVLSLFEENVTATSIPIQGVATTDEPIVERSANHGNNRNTRQNRRRRKNKKKQSVPSGMKKVRFSTGLWYFSVCVLKHCGKNKCDTTSYHNAARKSNSLPDKLQGAGLETIYTNIGEIAVYGIVEFQIEVIVSIICLLIGILTTRMFFDTENGHKLLFGLTTLTTHITAGFLLIAIAVRFAIMRIQVGAMLAEYRFFTLSPLNFEHSACPVLACVSGIFALCCSVALLVILSNDRRAKSNAISCSGSIPGPPSGMVSITGCQTFNDLMRSQPYTKRQSANVNEATTLSEKQAK